MSDISGANASTYTVTSGELGERVRVMVRAQAEDGTWSAWYPSDFTDAVVAAGFQFVIYDDNQRSNPVPLAGQTVSNTAYVGIAPTEGVTAVRYWDIGHTAYHRPTWAVSGDAGYAQATQQVLPDRTDTTSPFDAHGGGTTANPEALGPNLSNIGTSAPTTRTWYAEVDANATTYQIKGTITISNPSAGGTVSTYPFKRIMGLVAFDPSQLADREASIGREIDKVSLYLNDNTWSQKITSLDVGLADWAADPLADGTKRMVLVSRFLTVGVKGGAHTTLAQIASGVADDHIEALADICSERYGDDLDKLVFSAHEYNYIFQPLSARSDSGWAGASVSNFRNAIRHFITVFRARLDTLGHNGEDVIFAMVPGTGEFATASTARGVGFGGEHFLCWPGDDYISAWGGNLYDNRGRGLTPGTDAYRVESRTVGESQVEEFMRAFADADAGNAYVEAAHVAAGGTVGGSVGPHGGRVTKLPMIVQEWSLMHDYSVPPRKGGDDHPEWITMWSRVWRAEHAKAMGGKQTTLGRRILGLWHFDRDPSGLACRLTPGRSFPFTEGYTEYRRSDRFGGSL